MYSNLYGNSGFFWFEGFSGTTGSFSGSLTLVEFKAIKLELNFGY